jgi:hypothetical protein
VGQGKIEIAGDIVVAQLVDDAVAVNLAMRDCIDNLDAAQETDRQLVLGFSHYAMARPVGLSKCGPEDAGHILDALLDLLLESSPGLDNKLLKRLMPSTHRLFSGGDPANTHIRTSLAFCLQGLQNGGCRITEDNGKLRLLIGIAESLQVEIKVFLDTVLEQYQLKEQTP